MKDNLSEEQAAKLGLNVPVSEQIRREFACDMERKFGDNYQIGFNHGFHAAIDAVCRITENAIDDAYKMTFESRCETLPDAEELLERFKELDPRIASPKENPPKGIV